MASKKKKSPDYCASKCGTKERFGYVYASMLRDPAYLGLSLAARQLYTVLRVHAASEENRRYLYKHAQEESGAAYTYEYFVFPPSHHELYGYKDRANVNKYLSELAAAGFIRKVEDNRYRCGRPNVYRFAADWKN